MTTSSAAGIQDILLGLTLDAPNSDLHDCHILTNPLDLCRLLLAQLLAEILGCEPEEAYRAIQWPNNIFNGDLTVTLPKLRPGVKPAEFVPELMKKFPKDHPLFPHPIIDGVHMRVFLSPEMLPKLFIPYILERKTSFGNNPTLGRLNSENVEERRKKLLVEFSSPNIANEFQAKHLRSTILGAFVSNIHEHMGWDVTRINYLGDWGKPIALLKVGWDKFGSHEEYKDDPVHHLLYLYHQIDELFQPEVAASRQARDEAAKNGQDEGEAQVDIESRGIYFERNTASKRLEDGEEGAVEFWKLIRDANIENYSEFYAQLGVRFDEYTGESQVKPETITEVEHLLKEKEICKESAGAWVVHMQDFGLKAGTAIIRDRNGATTYLLRDLAAVLERSRQYDFDKMIIVAGSDNSVHFTHVHHILSAMGMEELSNKIQHLKFTETTRLSDTLGTMYKPEAIIEHCEAAMLPVLEAEEEKTVLFKDNMEAIKALGISALLISELSTRTATSHSFNSIVMTTFKSGTGPELQYWYAKLVHVLDGHTASSELSDEDVDVLADDEPSSLLRIILQFPEIIRLSYQTLEPAAIVAYLSTVTEQLADCLEEGIEDDTGSKDEDEENIRIKEEKTLKPGQISLYESARIVLENGMAQLGLVPLTKLAQQRADTPVAD
ncbi:unnamed protein product [Periconia digitata]|uniref:arginine--tRNA ligase n=1 Tax=Periconia digitata TaxID=1303443 RepID=A0A9W4UTA4_9PLEO|nr:unnamed protein product [Periconia digitata]